MSNNNEEYVFLVEQFNAYMKSVKQTTMETYQESLGTRHELAARTAANCVNSLFIRWSSAYDAVKKGDEAVFPDKVEVKREETEDDK